MNRIFFLALFLGCVYSNAAFAFCGFYVGNSDKQLFSDATRVVLMRDGTTTSLAMQNDYDGPPEDFAMVIPVPVVLTKSQVKPVSNAAFKNVEQLTSPRLVEYWEQDPCYHHRFQTHGLGYGKGGMGALGLKGVGRGSGAMGIGSVRAKPKVRVKERFDVEEYEIVILDADDSSSLDTWLREKNYNIPKKAAKYFQPYIESGMYFFVAKVDVKKIKQKAGGKLRLNPLRFHYQSETFSLPIRLGLINSRGKQDLIVNIIAKHRYEVANYKNVAIPTNLAVKKSVKKNFNSFYATLFDRVVNKHPGAVVTEYSWLARKCDPCPGGGAMGMRELNAFGLQDVAKNPNGAGWVVTRLHTRYSAKTVGEDLVFKKAEPMVGGRPGEYRYPKAGTVNAFQARYIIRHRWNQKLTCSDPKRGIWSGSPQMTSTKNAEYAKRNVVLKSVVHGKLPFMGVSTAKIKQKPLLSK